MMILVPAAFAGRTASLLAWVLRRRSLLSPPRSAPARDLLLGFVDTGCLSQRPPRCRAVNLLGEGENRVIVFLAIPLANGLPVPKTQPSNCVGRLLHRCVAQRCAASVKSPGSSLKWRSRSILGQRRTYARKPGQARASSSRNLIVKHVF
jgi:hypothetical protein